MKASVATIGQKEINSAEEILKFGIAWHRTYRQKTTRLTANKYSNLIVKMFVFPDTASVALGRGI